MKLGFTGDGVHPSEYLSGFNLVAGFHINACQLAIEGEIPTMLHQYALVVSGDYHNIAYGAIENRFDSAVFGKSDVEAVVERQLDIFINRMIVLPKRVYNGTVGRPREFPSVCGELIVEFDIYFRLRFLYGLLNHLVHLRLENFHLLLFCCKFLLIAGLVPVQARNQLLRGSFIFFQSFEFSHPFGTDL